jgi:hypothetical protein
MLYITLSNKRTSQVLLILLILAVVAAVYGLSMVVSIIGYFFLFIGLGILVLLVLIVFGAVLSAK